MRTVSPLAGALLAGALALAVAAPAAADVTGSPSPTAQTSTAAAAGNSDPTAMPDTATVETGQTVTIEVLANDTDPDHDPLTVTFVTNPQNGSAAVAGDAKSVTYASNPTFVGSDTFTYTVSDGNQGTDTGTVTVTVAGAGTNTVTVPATAIALRTASITGTVDPTSPAPVSVVLQRVVSGRLSTAASTVASSTGSYAFSYVPPAAGAIVWQTTATWADKTTATSASHTMNVVARLDPAVSGPLARADVPYSYRPGCPVSPAGLRRITMTFINYKGILRRGQLIVSAGSVPDLVNVFQKGFTAGFPIKKMYPTDRYYKNGTRSPTKSDIAAMKKGNTSAFNCRPVTGNPYRQSQHSYGNAIDINTFENPYVTGSRVYPSAARSFLNRTNHRKGMLLKKGPIRTAMRANGWPWGGRWSHPDYQHFSSNGG